MTGWSSLAGLFGPLRILFFKEGGCENGEIRLGQVKRR